MFFIDDLDSGELCFGKSPGDPDSFNTGVTLPIANATIYLEHFNQMDVGDALGAAENIAFYQRTMPKRHAAYIAQYSLFLGSFGDLDLYSLSVTHQPYTTGIVYGSEPENYKSGWIELCLSKEDRHSHYRELLARESTCLLITEDTYAAIGKAMISHLASEKDWEIYQALRKASV